MAAVRRMLAIVHGSDKKSAVMAFKALTDCAGIRGDGEGTRSGPSFTFVLPDPGSIPIRVANDAPIDVVAPAEIG